MRQPPPNAWPGHGGLGVEVRSVRSIAVSERECAGLGIRRGYGRNGLFGCPRCQGMSGPSKHGNVLVGDDVGFLAPRCRGGAD